MASADDYAAWIVQNADKRGTPEFDTVAKAYQLAKTEAVPFTLSDPSAGGGTLQFGPIDTGIHTPQWLDRGLAGTGKAFADTGRQLVNYATLGGNKAAIDEAKVRDAPLMNTGAGMAGNFVGNLAQMLGGGAAAGAFGTAAKLPQLVNAARGFLLPQSIPAAVGSGAIMGALEPTGTGESPLKNIGVGAIGGAAIPALAGAARVGGSLVAPFMQSGREKLAGSTLERFASDPNAILAAKGGSNIPGSVPTLAESVDDVGLSQLQRTLQNNPDSAGLIAERLRANNNARVGALQDIAGDQGKRDLFTSMRDEGAKADYGLAFAQQMNESPWIKGQITQLSQRPAFNRALDKAAELAANEGVKLNPENATQISHYAKMALDDQLSSAVRAGNNVEARGIASTRDKLVSLIESPDFSPAYQAARQNYAAASRPINQMDVGQKLLDTLQPALGQFGADTRVNAASYAKALRDADATAAKATGFPGAKLDNIMEPQQLATLNDIGNELGNTARAQELGMAKGSPTAQNLISQDVLRQTLGPLGLPQSWAEAVLPQTLMRGAQFAYKLPEQKVLGLLAQAALDPKEAQRLLLFSRQRGPAAAALEKLLPYTSAPGTAGLLSLSQ